MVKAFLHIRYPTAWCCLILLCMASTTAAGQRRSRNSIFKAGVMLGVNRAQVDGDAQYGYTKTGIMGGLRGGIILHKNFEIGTELLYSQRGSKPKEIQLSDSRNRIFIDLHYAEAALLARLRARKSEDRAFSWDFYGGISYGRLVRSDTRAVLGVQRIDTLRQNTILRRGYNTSDLSFVAGASWYLTERIGLTARQTISVSHFYDNPTANDNIQLNQIGARQRNYTFFRSYFITIGLFYDFIAPKTKKPVKRKPVTQ
jgi:Outer membrane protein beta-barrel domain